MKDRIPLYPGRVKLNPVTGQENTYDMVRADEPTQEGTPLNKASLLQDETAALYGQGADAVPNDILSILSNAALSIDGSLQDIGGNKVGPRIATGSYTGTGTYGASKPCSLTFDFEPKFLMILMKTESEGYSYSGKDGRAGFYINGLGRMITLYYDSQLHYASITVGSTGASFKWYSTTNSLMQLNASGKSYYYIAIG